MSPRRTVLKSGAEAEEHFQAAVLRVAGWRGWLAYHTRDSRRSRAGFVDLVLVKPPRCLLVELKSVEGTLSGSQRLWISALAACPGVETYCWTPADWRTIDQTLA